MSSLSLTIKQIQLNGISSIYILMGIKELNKPFCFIYSLFSKYSPVTHPIQFIICVNLAFSFCISLSFLIIFVVCVCVCMCLLTHFFLFFNSSQTKSILHSLLFLCCSKDKLQSQSCLLSQFSEIHPVSGFSKALYLFIFQTSPFSNIR